MNSIMDERHNEQLISLFDLLPDSLFICTKSKDKSDPKVVFANSRLNQFFGVDVLSKKQMKKAPKLGTRRQPKSILANSSEQLPKNPLKHKIFSKRRLIEDYRSEEENFDLSLLDTVKEYEDNCRTARE